MLSAPGLRQLIQPWYNYLMKPKGTSKLKAKLLGVYYGNPAKDMKLIIIVGEGKVTVSHYVHEILRAAGEQVAVFASNQFFKMSVLHKFLNDAWKAGANYVVITAPLETLQNGVFADLPIHVAAATELTEDFTATDLFKMAPKTAVLPLSNSKLPELKDVKGDAKTVTFGQTTGCDVKTLKSKLYKRGCEATLMVEKDVINPATFISGEAAVNYMALATAIAHALEIKNDAILDGIANYDPENK